MGQSKDHNSVVASESAVCSNIAIDPLKRGVNVADAFVGTVLYIRVICVYHSG